MTRTGRGMNLIAASLACGLLCCGLALVGCESDADPRDFRVSVYNRSAEPVEVYIDDQLQSEVAPAGAERINVGEGVYEVSLRRPGGAVLFAQSVRLIEGAVIQYTVAADGSVTASGDSQDPDADFDSGKREVRVVNNFGDVIFAFIDGEFRADVDSGRRETIKITGGPHRVSLRELEGKVLFEQTVQLVAGTFARYVIAEDGSVVAGGGTIWDSTS